MVKDRKIYGILKENINLLIVIILFIVLCVSYILVIPVFEAPDEPGHFLYAFYISKYNKIPSPYNEPMPTEQYIKENIDEKVDKVFYMDENHMFYKEPGSLFYMDQRHHPPIYYLISSQIIKPFNVDNIYIKNNLNQSYSLDNKFIDNKILKNNSSTISLVLILRLFQIVYGVLIIFFIFKIIKLLSDDEFKNNSILLISGIAFLPQFVFLCSYINNDVLSSLFGLISAYFIVLLFKRDKAYLGLLSILFAIIGGFTKYTILIMIPITIVAFFVWLIIKKKIWAILVFLTVMFLAISVFFYIQNFQRSPYQTEIEEGWVDSYKYENVEGDNDVLALEKNHAFSFDGIDDRVVVTRDDSLKTSDITVEFWVKSNEITTTEDWDGIMQGVDGSGYNSGWRILDIDNKLCLQVNFGDADPRYIIGYVLSSDTFYHVAFVYNHQYLRLYQNGNAVGTHLAETRDINWSKSATDLYIGFAQFYFNGAIDEVRIWNVARTQEQIRNNMNRELAGNEEGLIGYWKFNEGTGSTVYDSTANKNHGEIQVTSKESNISLLNKILGVSSKLLEDFRDSKGSFNINIPALTGTFKSTVVLFGWVNIAADDFIYYFFLAYVISGILTFFVNIRDYRKSKKSIIFTILSIISIFIYFLLYASYGNWAQNQGRIILLAVFLTYIIAILGFRSVKARNKAILYYTLFSSSLLISVFCLYNYIYLKYY